MPGFLAWIYLGSAVADLLAATALAFGTSAQPAKRPILISMVLVGLWAFADFLASVAQTGDQMRIFSSICAPVWTLVPFFLLRSMLAYMGAERVLRSFVLNGLMLLPVVGILILEWIGLMHSHYIPAHVNGLFFQSVATPWIYPMLIYFIGYILLGAVLTARHARRTGVNAFRGPGRLALLVFTPAVFFGGLLNGGLSLFGFQTPYLGSIIACFVGLITTWWIFRRSVFVPLEEAKRLTERALQVSRDRYQALMEMSPDGIIASDLEGKINFVNRRTLDLLGFGVVEEMLSVYERVQDINIPEERSRLEEALRKVAESGAILRQECRVKTQDEHLLELEFSIALLRDEQGEPSGTICMARDISLRRRMESERRDLEAQVQHAQKLESLGLLAGGIAHDFNNLLSGVLGHASLARLDVSEDSPMAERLEKIEMAAKRAAKLTHEMLAYAGRGRFVIEDVDIEQLVNDMAELLQVSVSKKVQLTRSFEAGLPRVRGDTGQIQQVIMNLITNASEALGSTPGAIRLAAHRCRLEKDEVAHAGGREHVPSGKYICLEVEDEGEGMDEQTLSRMFEPFFSTKFTGRGLGLAAVQGIIRSHGGGISVDSRPGDGTRIRVYWPMAVHSRVDEVESSNLGREALARLIPQGGVLVVDDESLVRDVVAGALRRFGFEVWTAVDGLDGLRVFEQHTDRIAVVVLDMTMPRMDGHEVFAALRSKRIDLPILLISGYHEDDALEALLKEPWTGFLPKPFVPDDLLNALGMCLSDEIGINP
ncbi:MAG: response regulator [Deltaproteobacteria bacterium]|nr:response regulator [Deltaproteobacteria bacterium]